MREAGIEHPRRRGGEAGWRRAAGVLLLAAAAACGGEAEGGEAAAMTPGAAEGVAEPATAVEGEPYRSPEGFALPFYTVLPEGFEAQPGLEGPGTAVRFVWAPQGEARDSSFVYVRVMAPGTAEDRAREIVRTAAERLRIPGDRTELEPRQEHPWAVVEYPLRSMGTFGEPLVGWIALGAREGRWFYLTVQAPEDEWPVFEPRAGRILDAWRWLDADGEPGPVGLEPAA